jgi:hypothetical protein
MDGWMMMMMMMMMMMNKMLKKYSTLLCCMDWYMSTNVSGSLLPPSLSCPVVPPTDIKSQGVIPQYTVLQSEPQITQHIKFRHQPLRCDRMTHGHAVNNSSYVTILTRGTDNWSGGTLINSGVSRILSSVRRREPCPKEPRTNVTILQIWWPPCSMGAPYRAFWKGAGWGALSRPHIALFFLQSRR